MPLANRGLSNLSHVASLNLHIIACRRARSSATCVLRKLQPWAAMRAAITALLCSTAAALVVPLQPARPAQALDIALHRVKDGASVHLGDALAATTDRTLLCFGTHAAARASARESNVATGLRARLNRLDSQWLIVAQDFNAIEYLQKVRFYLPRLRDAGVRRVACVLNADAAQCRTLAELLDVPDDVELFADPTGAAGRKFGVSRGFRPDDGALSPYVKLFVVGIGLGPPWGTLLPVIRGYVGAPSGKRDWIEACMQQAQRAGRVPEPLELATDGSVAKNRFDDTPLLSDWGVRPFELATMRLQNLSMQISRYGELGPKDPRCLTQLGGMVVVGAGGEPEYAWLDQGLCDLPDFEDVLGALS